MTSNGIEGVPTPFNASTTEPKCSLHFARAFLTAFPEGQRHILRDEVHGALRESPLTNTNTRTGGLYRDYSKCRGFGRPLPSSRCLAGCRGDLVVVRKSDAVTGLDFAQAIQVGGRRMRLTEGRYGRYLTEEDLPIHAMEAAMLVACIQWYVEQMNLPRLDGPGLLRGQSYVKVDFGQICRTPRLPLAHRHPFTWGEFAFGRREDNVKGFFKSAWTPTWGVFLVAVDDNGVPVLHFSSPSWYHMDHKNVYHREISRIRAQEGVLASQLRPVATTVLSAWNTKHGGNETGGIPWGSHLYRSVCVGRREIYPGSALDEGEPANAPNADTSDSSGEDEDPDYTLGTGEEQGEGDEEMESTEESSDADSY